jgi:hypothetical protein
MRITAAAKIITGALVFALPGAAFALGDAAVAREPGKLKISWTSPNPVDVFVADRPDASMKAATRVASADRDGKVNFVEPGTVRRYFLLRDTRTGKSTASPNARSRSRKGRISVTSAAIRARAASTSAGGASFGRARRRC